MSARNFTKKSLLALSLLVFGMFTEIPSAVGQKGCVAPSPSGFTGPVSTIEGVDILGAHDDYGRGCAGCHAVHNGVRGKVGKAGPNVSPYASYATDPDFLFGQDLSTLYGVTLRRGNNGRFETLPLNSLAPDDETRMIAMCLTCHDGNITIGGMVKGMSYEQAMGLLPANVYGNQSIPSLLGKNPLSSYHSIHPVGTNATLGKLTLVRSNVMNSCVAADSLCWTWNTVNTPPTLQSVTPQGSYANFVVNYGYPAIAGSPHTFGIAVPPSDTTGDPTQLYVTCTTCHNQHSPYFYTEPGKQASAKIYCGTYSTYFFINSPYNSYQPYLTPQQASSATQFCRQCHSSKSNEAAGVNGVTTSF